jgi:hypothetical protein
MKDTPIRATIERLANTLKLFGHNPKKIKMSKNTYEDYCQEYRDLNNADSGYLVKKAWGIPVIVNNRVDDGMVVVEMSNGLVRKAKVVL